MRNPLQLGLFSTNIERGGSISTAPGLLPLDWDGIRDLAVAADRMGLEFIVPVARWRGFGGVTDYAGSCFDTLCFAAGLAAATERISVMSTIHVPTMHPLVAAKQLATIDHISHGRAAVNVVGGWFRPELEMFGAPMLDHDDRYALAEEWVSCVEWLWTREEPLDFQGRFFTVVDGVSHPKPVQRPRPRIMNAGGSDRGRRFAAEFADMVLVLLHDEDEVTAQQVQAYKTLARAEFGRELQAWATVTVTCYPDEAQARAVEQDVLRGGDYQAVDTMLSVMGIESGIFPPQGWQRFRDRFVTGWGSPQLTGTPEQVVERMAGFARAGVDGLLITFPHWTDGLDILGRDILPGLQARGLRMPATALGAAR